MSLHIPSINAPASIKQRLTELSTNIKLDKESSKGANGFLFFGTRPAPPKLTILPPEE